MTPLIFVVPGPPVGKQRARVTRKGHAYTPALTVNYEALVKQMFSAMYPNHVPFKGPANLVLRVYVLPSKDMARRLKKTPGLRPVVKPDIDNVLKLFADALNGLAYVDDKQIVCAMVVKYFGDRPHVEVAVGEMAAVRGEAVKAREEK